ncbi:adenylate/guanylate cyclase with Chase sensor [Candidatus Vecturithrix granuli]|uniref:Adenylate/guanylate cyclase with Chase sensor n=1 Tax=Vecturithrix granuli TaxID=1499967 RepID=A0A081BY96_VECG1|nr:adenylate/guanylate cyclase with Chase sensor [Candidatus Vecturithrix granuli]
MHKFSQFDLHLNIRRLPLTYSLGDLTAIREIFTPENGDSGRTQLPNLPPISEPILQNGNEIEGYFVQHSPAIMVAIRKFLQEIAAQTKLDQQSRKPQHSELIQNYADVRRECISRIGGHLLEIVKQERRLGLYNLYWLVLSKYLVNLLETVISEKGEKKNRLKLTILPIIAQAFQETIEQVKRYFQKYDIQKRRYSQYIDDTMISHLGSAFNYEFSRAVITEQVHLVFPMLSAHNVLECAQAIFAPENKKYHISYQEFFEIYSGVRAYMERQWDRQDAAFGDMIATVLKIPLQTVKNIPIEALLFHPTIITILAEEIKRLPVKGASRKKVLFKSWTPQLGNMIGEDSWEFALSDYLSFAKDLRRSEIILFLRQRIQFIMPAANKIAADNPKHHSDEATADKISYQFEKGAIINDLRHVTLLLLDLRGFTELSASDISDHQLKEHLYNFFDPAVNILNHFGGIIKTYAGDGILASFGGQKDHALNAVRAAIEIQKLFQRLKHDQKIAFAGMGIGIHSGLVEETYFFPDLESPSHNTVIGLTANLVGRLSSGKVEKKRQFDKQAISALNEYLQVQTQEGDITPASLAIFEDRLFQALETLQQQQFIQSVQEEFGQKASVSVVHGVLNNNGIAISNATFKHIHALESFQEIEAKSSVKYSYLDKVLQERILLIKAGDAMFKGIEGKFPVWGVYVDRKASTAKTKHPST